MPRTLRLPLLDKCEVVGVVDALKCVDLYSARGFSRIDAVSENQLPGLRRKLGRNFQICDDIDRLRGVLRKRGADVSKQTGHDHDGRDKTSMHWEFPLVTRWIAPHRGFLYLLAA